VERAKELNIEEQELLYEKEGRSLELATRQCIRLAESRSMPYLHGLPVLPLRYRLR
jgi:hypothetical protein